MKLIVMIPAFNEEETIGGVVGEIPRRLDGIERVEVLICDDGSTDRTAAAAIAAGADHVIRHRANFGLTAAFSTALSAALALGADIIVNTDADGQYDPQDMRALIAPILRGDADMVSGDRQVRYLEHMPASKKYGNIIGSWMLRATAKSMVHDASSGYRAFSRHCALRLNPDIGHTYTHQTLIQAANSKLVVAEVPVRFRRSARRGGKSRLISGVGTHILQSLGTIIRSLTTYRPMAVLGTAGLAFILAAALLGLIPLANWVRQGNTEGHLQSLIAAGVLGLVGLQLFVFALLAETMSANRRLTEEVLVRLKAGGAHEKAVLPPIRPAGHDQMTPQLDRESPPTGQTAEELPREVLRP